MTAPSPGLRALVVEDDPAIREILGLHLGLAGFQVEDVADGRKALDRVRQQQFDLLLLDIMLPGLDGVSLCRAARKEGPNVDTPILMLTARQRIGHGGRARERRRRLLDETVRRS
jgi:DNA-binding response OmpR family regulator